MFQPKIECQIFFNNKSENIFLKERKEQSEYHTLMLIQYSYHTED